MSRPPAAFRFEKLKLPVRHLTQASIIFCPSNVEDHGFTATTAVRFARQGEY